MRTCVRHSAEGGFKTKEDVRQKEGRRHVKGVEEWGGAGRYVGEKQTVTLDS